MAVNFEKKSPPWVDVEDPSNPPPGAEKIMAADLNRIETAVDELAEESDQNTGQRDISSLLSSSATANGLRIQRIGNSVEVTLTDLAITGTSSLMFGPLPLGFRPVSQRAATLPAALQGSGIAHRAMALSTAGNLSIYNAIQGDVFRNFFTYLTADPWPETLPGTPV